MDVQPQGADAPSFDEELIEPVGSSRNVSTLSSHVLRPLTVGFSSTGEVFCFCSTDGFFWLVLGSSIVLVQQSWCSGGDGP